MLLEHVHTQIHMHVYRKVGHTVLFKISFSSCLRDRFTRSFSPFFHQPVISSIQQILILFLSLAKSFNFEIEGGPEKRGQTSCESFNFEIEGGPEKRGQKSCEIVPLTYGQVCYKFCQQKLNFSPDSPKLNIYY